MSDDSLTHANLSRLLGVSVTTIKSYRRKFPGFLPALTAGKPLRFPASTAQVCADIRDAFSQGLSVRETTELLTSRYPELSLNRHLPIIQAFPDPALGQALAALTRDLAELTLRLDAALARLDQLEAQTASSPDPGKVIRIRTQDGAHQRFRLTPLGPEPDEISAPEVAQPKPPAELLDNPLVVRSDQGEFLGIAGTRSRHFRLRDLLDILAAKHPAALSPAWTQDGAVWTLTIPLGAEPYRQDHTLVIEACTTPRGNQVTQLTAMAVADKPAPHSFLHAFLRQLRKEQQE
jgi:DNA-binding transcriptional MerR regulator